LRKALLIIASIAGCSFLEAAFLLCYLLPEREYWHAGTSHTFLGCAQYLLLPSVAALYSLLMYGQPGWGRRALVILLAGAIGAPLLLAILLLPLVFLVWAADINPALGLAVLPFVIGGMTWALFFAIRKTGERSVETEAARWLSEREAGVSPRERKLRNLGISWSLWVPALTVLAVVLFLPETWGLVTHLRHPETSRLAGYHVSLPITWIVLSTEMDSATGRCVVGGIAGRGCTSVRCLLLRGDFSLFYWGLETEPYSQVRNGDNRHGAGRMPPREPIDKRVFKVGDSTLTCLEFATDYTPLESTAFRIECSGSGRLHASFLGERRYLPVFYEMLGGIAKTE
jgi:hypothetical protein